MTKQEAKEAFLRGDISYDEFVIILKEMDAKVSRLDEKVSQTHSMVANLDTTLRTNLSTLVNSNQEAVNTLKDMRQDQKENVAIIAGKSQVPYPIFLLVVAIMAILIAIEKVERSGTTIEVSPNSVKVSPVEGAVDDRRATPTPGL